MDRYAKEMQAPYVSDWQGVLFLNQYMNASTSYIAPQVQRECENGQRRGTIKHKPTNFLNTNITFNRT